MKKNLDYILTFLMICFCTIMVFKSLINNFYYFSILNYIKTSEVLWTFLWSILFLLYFFDFLRSRSKLNRFPTDTLNFDERFDERFQRFQTILAETHEAHMRFIETRNLTDSIRKFSLYKRKAKVNWKSGL